MHEGLWNQLEKLDPVQTARRAGCRWEDGGYWVIRFLNRDYQVDPVEKTIREVDKESAGFIEQLCILAYLIQAQDIPLRGKLVKAEQLPGGAFFFRGIHDLPTGELAEALGEEPEKLWEAGKALGARQCEYGDASIEIDLLPRLPITIILWAGDEEFPGRASILFDPTAADHIALDALQAGVQLVVKTLLAHIRNA
jgi:uncharacterized protein DUF3786